MFLRLLVLGVVLGLGSSATSAAVQEPEGPPPKPENVLDPPGAGNALFGNDIPNGTYAGRVDKILVRVGTDPDGNPIYRVYYVVTTTVPIAGPPAFPAGTRLYLPKDEKQTDKDEAAALEVAVNQNDGNNEVTMNGGNVTGVRTAPNVPGGSGNEGDG